MAPKTQHAATRACTIAGMAMAWTGVHNQLLYPLTYTYGKPGAPSVFVLYLVYVLIAVATIAVIGIARHAVSARVFSSPVAMAVAGVLGTLGMALLVKVDFATEAGAVLVTVGAALCAMQLPLYFVFWSFRIASEEDVHETVFDAIAAYLAFCIFVGLRVFLGWHQSMFSIAIAAVSTVLAAWVARCPHKRFSTRASGIRQMPLDVLVPCLVLIYVCSLVISLFNPNEAVIGYPKDRSLIYIIDAAIFVLIALVYWKLRDSPRRFSIVAFCLVAAHVIVMILVNGFGLKSDSYGMGNFPVIAGKIAIDCFVWLLIVQYSRNKHIDAVLPLSCYLILAIEMPNIVSVILLYTSGTILESATSPEMVSIVFGSAFAISMVLNIVLMALYMHADKAFEEIEHGAFEADGSLDKALALFAKSNGLSEREAQIARMLYDHDSAKKIAETLSIAESTVYTHTKHFYHKADLHSRDELINLVDRYRDE